MLCYVIFGGMVATTWVQIVKAVLLMTGILVMSIFVLGKVGFNPIELFNRAEENTTAESTFSLGPGTYLPKPLDTVSLGLALVLGTAGLPHILMRFFTVPTAKAARSSVVWAMFIIGFFYLLTTFIGFGARAFLGEGGVEAAGTGGNLAAPNLAAFLGGGEGTFGGDLFLAAIAGVAFATILAVVAGLVLSASAAFSHDIWSSIVRKHKDSEHEEVLVARIAAFAIGVIAIIIAVIGGSGLNVSFMVGLAFAVAASANFPALLLALTWRRFNTTGAITGVVVGVVSSIFLVIVSPEGVAGRRHRDGLADRLGALEPRASSRSRSASWAATWARSSAARRRTSALRRAVRALRDRPRRRAGAGEGRLLALAHGDHDEVRDVDIAGSTDGVDDRVGDRRRVERLERGAHALQRVARRAVLHAVAELGGHDPRLDRLHAHAARAELQAQGARQVLDGGLGRAVDAVVRERLVPADRADVDEVGGAAVRPPLRAGRR